MTVSLEVRALGPLEVRRDGELVRLGAQKQRRLLGLLLIHRSGGVDRDLAVDALWGERPPKNARNAVQVYVSSLRRLLGREAIVTTAAGYRLDLAAGAVDVDRFEDLHRSGAETLSAGDAASARESLSEALSLWRGPAFADLRYEAFAQAEAGRLQELRSACLEERIEADLQLGRHSALVGELEALVAEQPLRERSRSQLILALYRSGRQSEALAQYQAARRMLAEELGLEPSPQLRELERMILAHDPSLVASPAQSKKSRSHLPLQPTPFIGRKRELAEIVEVVRSGGRRLVTLTGPGGSGKTRLAIEAGRTLVDDYPDGAYWTSLQALRDPELVLPTIASAIGVAGEPTSYIGDKRLLLLVDNCEHLPEIGSDLASLLYACPNLTVVATSREPLHVAAEREYEVPPMIEVDAVTLFCERAYRSEPIDTVATICEKLDRLPLAIELAAVRTKNFDLDAVEDRLEDRLAFLTGGPRDAPARQRTLRAAIEWSYELLVPEEQRVYARLAVFRGGATLSAAEAVCDTDSAQLEALCDKHLLTASNGRYRMLQTIREHAREHLEKDGDAEAVRSAHARWFLALAEEVGGALPQPLEAPLEAFQYWRPLIEAELDNLRAAMQWSIDHRDREQALRLANGLACYWDRGGAYAIEGARWLSEALDAPGPLTDTTRATAQRSLGLLLLITGRAAEAELPLLDALEIYRSMGEDRSTFETLRDLALVKRELRDLDGARDLLEAARDLHLEDQQHLVDAVLGLVEMDAGRLALARKLFEQSLLQAHTSNHLRKIGALVMCVAELDLAEAAFDRAEYGYRQSLKIFLSYAYDANICMSLGGLAAVCAGRGELERAGRLWAVVQAQEQLGTKYDAGPRERHARWLDSHAEPEYLRGLEQGQSFNLEAAVAHALDESA
jgi:predicted ATPase/DNA-binding SARP family transcriptional activator